MFFMAMVMTLPSFAKKLVIIAPDHNNQKVIKRYNRYKHRDRFMSGAAQGYTAVFGVRTNSVMSTDDVEVNVVKKWVQDAAVNDQDNCLYFVEIKNKSDDTVYIDKGYCFRIYNNGSRYRYFDPKKELANSAKRFIVIPPHSKRNLSDYKAELINKGKYRELKIVDYPEEFYWTGKSAGVFKGRLNVGEVLSFSEDTSPYYRSFLITYSKEKEFSEYSYLTINLYMRQLIGAYFPERYQGCFYSDFSLIGGDKYTITSSEWVGEIRPL
jgi:hypothetical protein